MTGPLVHEVWQVWSPGVQTVFRLYTGTDALANGYIEVDHGIGPLPGNHEVITRYRTQLCTTTACTTAASADGEADADVDAGAGTGAGTGPDPDAGSDGTRAGADGNTVAGAGAGATDGGTPVWFGDNNGQQYQRRVSNAAAFAGFPDATYNISANYAPMVRSAFIRDDGTRQQLSVLSSRTHGAASLVRCVALWVCVLRCGLLCCGACPCCA